MDHGVVRLNRTLTLSRRRREADQDAFDEIGHDLLVAENESEGDDTQAALAMFVLARGRAELVLGLLARHPLARRDSPVVPVAGVPLSTSPRRIGSS